MSHENFVLDGVLYKDVNEASEKLNRCKKVIINALNMGKTSLKGIRRKRRYIVVDDIVYTSKDITKLAKEHNVKRSAIRYQLQTYGNLDRIMAKNKRKEEVAKCQGKIVNDWLLEDVGKTMRNSNEIKYKGTHQVTGRIKYGQYDDFKDGIFSPYNRQERYFKDISSKLEKIKSLAIKVGFIVEYTVTKKEEYRKRYLHPVLDEIMNPKVSLKDRMSKEEILKLSVEEIDFGAYEMKALRALNCKTIKDVAKLTKEDILSVPHCGLKTVALIKSRLYDMGLI